jgi:hypothetical protein
MKTDEEMNVHGGLREVRGENAMGQKGEMPVGQGKKQTEGSK